MRLAPAAMRLPVIRDSVGAGLVHVDEAGMPLGAVADEPLGAEAGEVHADRDAVLDRRLGGGDEALARVQGDGARRRTGAPRPGAGEAATGACPVRTRTGKVRGEISA